jgi:tripartite-type tricarboxylate transporter receptor subunit TctC
MNDDKDTGSVNRSRRMTLQYIAGLTALSIAPSRAWAEGYPSHAIRMIVPFPPGGGFDNLARPFAMKLGAYLKQSIVVENKAGAGGNIGTAEAARAAPDGYTILLGNEILSTNPLIYKSLPYDSVKSFQPIALIATTPLVLAINPKVPARNLKELIALSAKEPITFGTPGIGTSPHLMGELLNQKSPLKLRHIPYKGTGPAITDALGGQINAVLSVASSLAPYIESGKLRGIALFSEKRSVQVPDLPTIAEAGLPGYTHDVWYALLTPAGTPQAIVAQLGEAAKHVLADKELAGRLRKLGFDPYWGDGKAVSKLITGDLERWGHVVAEAHIAKL